MRAVSHLVDRLRYPAYTGENRCPACTVLNVGIATSASLLVLSWALAADYPVAGAALASVLFAASLAMIWLRGYLVPGTPTVSRRLEQPDSCGVDDD